MTRRATLAGAAVSLLGLAVLRGIGSGPPLYDGLCLPPAYVTLGSHPGPPSRSQTFSATDLAGTFELADSDTTPQAQIIVGGGSLAPAAGSTTVTMSISPVAPPAVKPSDGTIDGNVYDFDARSGGREVSLAAGHPATVVLSATRTGGPQIDLEHFDGTRWHAEAKTFASGCGNTYEANSPTLGLFALVARGSTSVGSGPQGSGGPGVVIAVAAGAVVVVLAVLLGTARRRRGRLPRR